MMIIQDPTEVRTKASKPIETILLASGDDVERAFLDWVTHLRTELLYGEDDPAFPRTASAFDPDLGLVKYGLKPVCWSSSAPVREIFRRAFQ